MTASPPSFQRENNDVTPVRIERTTYSLGTAPANLGLTDNTRQHRTFSPKHSTTGPQQKPANPDSHSRVLTLPLLPVRSVGMPISVAAARAFVVDRKLFERTRLSLSGCREWTGAKQSMGYGHIGVEGHFLLVHRVFWVAERGEIPPGLTIDHLCRNRLCVLAAHLEVVTLAENTRRAHPLHAECIQGHSLSGSNLYIAPNGRRTCRACRNASAQRARTVEVLP